MRDGAVAMRFSRVARLRVWRLALAGAALGVVAGFWGCATAPDATTRYLGDTPVQETGGPNPHRAQIDAIVAAEPPGDYWVGRRYYKEAYKFWGYVKRPRAPWSTAKLVMLNENLKLAPDRGGKLGSDDGAEYHLKGRFTGGVLYDPSSDGFYPEFVLEDYRLVNPRPLSIYRDGRPNEPASNIIQRPQ